LPETPLMVSTTPCSFFSRHAVMKAPRSMARIRVRMPTAWSHPWIVSPMAL
jgi:hypothetical protein